MAISKSPEQDRELTERVLKTLDVAPHETPKYYEYLDRAVGHLNRQSPSVPSTYFIDHVSNKGSKDPVDVSSLPAVHAAKKAARGAFLEEVAKEGPSPEDTVIAHKAWEDVDTHTEPKLYQRYAQPVMGVEWKVHPDLPIDRTGVPFGRKQFEEHLPGDNKISSTSSGARLWSFIVHRVRHLSDYEAATPDTRQQMHNEWAKQQMDPGDSPRRYSDRDKQRTSLSSLKRLLVENPNHVAETLRHQRDLHNALTTHFSHVLQDKNGVPHIALSRGLDSESHGPDRTLSSYSGAPVSAFGEHSFRYSVPLDHVWYSYDMSPHAAEQDTEHEFVVDNEHPRIPLSPDVKLPVIPERFHSYDLSHPLTWPQKQQEQVIETALQHGVLPKWTSEINPGVILQIASRAEYLPSVARDQLAKLPIDPAAWAGLNTPIGLDMAIHSHKYNPQTMPWDKLLGSVFGQRWLISRYPHQLPNYAQNKLAASVLASGTAPRVQALLDRPDLRPDVKQALEGALRRPMSNTDFQDGWTDESLFRKASK